MKTINILHLYPNEMNTYGDHGNVLTLVRRCEWHGYDPVVHYHHPGGKLPAKIDVVVGGGGQDSAQSTVQADIVRIGSQLRELAKAGVPMLMVCGTYQLFGHKFVTDKKEEIKGIGIFDAVTIAGSKRMIGNIKFETEFGIIYGFENHSGMTTLAKGQPAFGKVVRGRGNNGQDKSEGARYKNVFGTYAHGPVLPNNPKFVDGLIALAAANAYGEFAPKKIDDSLAELARLNADMRSY